MRSISVVVVAIVAALFASDLFAQCQGGCNVSTRASSALVRAQDAIPSADLQAFRDLDQQGVYNTSALEQARRPRFSRNPVLGAGPVGTLFGTQGRQRQINELQIDATGKEAEIAVLKARLQALENRTPAKVGTAATKSGVLTLYLQR